MPHTTNMSTSESYAEAIRSIIAELRGHAPSHTNLNRAAIEIDKLGRHLGGLGLAHDRDIGACFTSAIAALAAAHPLDEEQRAAPVRQALGHLEAALAHAEGAHDHRPQVVDG